jgi:hypothetical protein
MKEIHTEIEINAPAETVWRVLTDFAAYPESELPFVFVEEVVRDLLQLIQLRRIHTDVEKKLVSKRNWCQFIFLRQNELTPIVL